MSNSREVATPRLSFDLRYELCRKWLALMNLTEPTNGGCPKERTFFKFMFISQRFKDVFALMLQRHFMVYVSSRFGPGGHQLTTFTLQSHSSPFRGQDSTGEMNLHFGNQCLVHHLLISGAFGTHLNHCVRIDDLDDWMGLATRVGLSEGPAASYIRMLFPTGADELLRLDNYSINCKSMAEVPWALIQRATQVNAAALHLRLFSAAKLSASRPFLPQVRSEATRVVHLELVSVRQTVVEYFKSIENWKPLLLHVLASCPFLLKLVVCLPSASGFLPTPVELTAFLSHLGALFEWVAGEMLVRMPTDLSLLIKAYYMLPYSIMPLFKEALVKFVKDSGFEVEETAEGPNGMEMLVMMPRGDKRMRIEASLEGSSRLVMTREWENDLLRERPLRLLRE